MKFPLDLTFKVTTLSNDFTVMDADGHNVAFVRQKMLKLKEQVEVFSDQSRSEKTFSIKANKWLDFSASYLFYDAANKELGRLVRKGWSSLWKAHYEIYDENQIQEFLIKENNPWIKVMDGALNELPIIGMFSGYFFNPSYDITRPDGRVSAQLKKQKSFFGRRFTVEKLGDFDQKEEQRILLGIMMMILLERARG